MDRVRLAEGRNRIIWQDEIDPAKVVVESKDEVTANDGRRHDVLPGKGIHVTEAACNVFGLLWSGCEGVAFEERIGERSFLAHRCTMIPYEFIVRRGVRGQYLRRNPDLKPDHVHWRPQVEVFLKTSGREWEGRSIPRNDPLVILDGWTGGSDGRALLYRADIPLRRQDPFMELDAFPMRHDIDGFRRACRSAVRAFLMLERSWAMLGYRLIDTKIEFGVTPWGELVIADTIDGDSWCVERKGGHLDKQWYRDGASLTTVSWVYEEIARATGFFRLPRQLITVWVSDARPIDPLLRVFERMRGDHGTSDLMMNRVHVPLSADGNGVMAELGEMTADGMDHVIVFDGDPAGETVRLLAERSPFPVIATAGNRTVPASAEGRVSPLLFAQDAPGAIAAALRILSETNPRLYADLRLEQSGYDVTSVR